MTSYDLKAIDVAAPSVTTFQTIAIAQHQTHLFPGFFSNEGCTKNLPKRRMSRESKHLKMDGKMFISN